MEMSVLASNSQTSIVIDSKNASPVIAKTPLLYPSVDHIRKGYRRSVCGVHSIYYRIQEEHIEIMRVLGRENPANLDS